MFEMRNYELGRDDWELDRGQDAIDDPVATSTKPTNYTVLFGDGRHKYIQAVSEKPYLIGADGRAFFVGAQLQAAGLPLADAQKDHTELSDDYREFALRVGDNQGIRVLSDADYEAEKAERRAARAAEEAKKPLVDRVLCQLDDLHYDPQLTGEFAEIEGIMKPAPGFWELWEKHKDEINALGFRVERAEDFGFWYVVIPKELR